MSAVEAIVRRGWKISIDLAANDPYPPTVCVTATRLFLGREKFVIGRDKDFDTAVNEAMREADSTERIHRG